MRIIGRILLLVGCVLLFVGTAWNVAQAQQGTSWVGEYFNNPTLSGSPVLTRADASISFVWGEAAPDPLLPADRFSVRWTRAEVFSAGTYRFAVSSDDGMRVYLDNTLILNAWYDHGPDPVITAEVSVTAGQHALRVEYYENSGSAVASLQWTLVSNLVTATWVAEYYNNPNLQGAASLQRTEQAIDYDWGFSSPFPGQIGTDNFSVRWTGSPYFNAGTYTITLYADDGVRLWVDNRLLIDAWYGSGFTPPRVVTVALTAGQHAFRVEYFEQFEVAAIRLEWTQTGVIQPTPIPPTPIPATPIPPVATSGAWQVEYFNNTTLTAPAAAVTQVATVNLDLDWRMGAPAAGVLADGFSARFTRQATFINSQVRFVVRADDGVRFYLDGALVLDEWHPSSGNYFFLDRTLTPGEHTLTLEFYEGILLSSLEFYWVYPRPASPATGVTAWVNAFQLNVRTGPGVSYPIMGRVRREHVFAVTGRSAADSRWVRVDFGGLEGWINGTWTTMQGDQALVPMVSGADATTPLTFGTPTGLRLVTTTNLNVRGGPGVSYPQVGWLVSGTEVDVVGKNAAGSWWEINFDRGRGWVSGAYVNLTGQLYATVPVTG